MAVKKLKLYPQSANPTPSERGAWLKLRRKGIGGSDIAAIMGLNRWKTPVQVWMEKTGRAPRFEGNNNTLGGVMCEPLAAELYRERHPETVVERYPYMVQRGCLIANIDRLAGPEEGMTLEGGKVKATAHLLEIKAPGSKRSQPEGEIPPHYEAQMLHYLGLFPTLEYAELVVLYRREWELQVLRLDRDDKLIKRMQDYAEEWWDFVRLDVPPPPTNESDCKAIWAESHPEKTAVATTLAEGAIESLRRIKKTRDALDTEEAEARTVIMATMKDAEVLLDAVGGRLATWKTSKDREVIDWKGLVKELDPAADIMAKYTTKKPGARPLLVKQLAE